MSHIRKDNRSLAAGGGWATFTWWERGSMCVESRWSTWICPYTSLLAPSYLIHSAVQAWKGMNSKDSDPLRMTVLVTPPDFRWGDSQGWREFRVEKGEDGYLLWPKINSSKGGCTSPHILWKRDLWEPWCAALRTWVGAVVAIRDRACFQPMTKCSRDTGEGLSLGDLGLPRGDFLSVTCSWPRHLELHHSRTHFLFNISSFFPSQDHTCIVLMPLLESFSSSPQFPLFFFSWKVSLMNHVLSSQMTKKSREVWDLSERLNLYNTFSCDNKFICACSYL